ncbi:protein translocase subunit SecDF [Mycoplasma buteonis]|uniref:protein translocase subunit SecDF n=1 Tax=Mycoplasma buteonis TaxID=171280 RepID=UPI00056AFC23|nr:protein translocase subunit SecDF [Mycoplasma buteonis]
MIKKIKNMLKITNFKRFLISFVTIASAAVAITLGSTFYVSKNVNKSIEYGGGVEVVVQAQVKDDKNKVVNADKTLTELVNKSLYDRLTGGTGLNGVTVSTEGDGKLRITKSGTYSTSQLDEFEKEIITKPILTITDTQMRPLFVRDGSVTKFVTDASLFNAEGQLENLSKFIPPFANTSNSVTATANPSTGQWSVEITLDGEAGRNAWTDATQYIANQKDNKMLIWLNLSDLLKLAQNPIHAADWEASGHNLWNFVHINNSVLNNQGRENALKENQFKAESYLISSPQVTSAITSPKTLIQGNFTHESALKLANSINFGLSNYELVPLVKYYLQPEKNSNAFNNAMIAGIVIFVVIALWMIVNYGLLGALSTISMSLYIFLTLLMFTVLRGEYSPATIAALIIGIGISVDANVITYERLKRQVYDGDSFKKAYKNSNRQSLSSILDANITTILVGFVLFYFGTKDVKGFSITLTLSVLFTLVVMLVFQRFLATMIANTGIFDNRLYLLGIRKRYIKNPTKLKEKIDNADFLKYAKWFVLISFIFILAGAIVFTILAVQNNAFSAGVNSSLEFRGGINLSIVGNENLGVILDQNSASEIKTELIKHQSDLGIDNLANLITSKVANQDTGSYVVSIETTQSVNQVELTAKINQIISQINPNLSILTFQVSNAEAQKLVLNALLATGLSFIAIILYLLFRMSYTYSIAAIVGLLHDFLMVVAFIVVTRLQVSTIVVAAMLAILGLSINDTVVTFDKIRETINSRYARKILSKNDIRMIINSSIADTLKRSIYTSLTTIFAIVVLLAFQNATDFAFNIIMLFGISIGVYSSIFICTRVWASLENKRQIRKAKRIQTGYWQINYPEEQTFNGINDYLD